MCCPVSEGGLLWGQVSFPGPKPLQAKACPWPISPLEVLGSLFLMCVKGRPVLWGGHETQWQELPRVSQDLAPGQPFSVSLYLDGLSVLKRRNTLGILFSSPFSLAEGSDHTPMVWTYGRSSTKQQSSVVSGGCGP